MYIWGACLTVATGCVYLCIYVAPVLRSPRTLADDSLYTHLSGAPAFLSPRDALAIFVTGFRPDIAIRYYSFLSCATPSKNPQYLIYGGATRFSMECEWHSGIVIEHSMSVGGQIEH
jgi:hypothetical protein